ncbi:MAG: tetratricopeptide repeat protein [Candidatus Sulfotelmatobacter sp.]
MNGDAEAIPFLKRAIELDPNFAMAYVGLGVHYSNLGQDSLAPQYAKRAYDLRDRVSDREKYRAGFHFQPGRPVCDRPEHGRMQQWRYAGHGTGAGRDEAGRTEGAGHGGLRAARKARRITGTVQKFDVPVEATTPSLEALKAYMQMFA